MKSIENHLRRMFILIPLSVKTNIIILSKKEELKLL